MIMDSRHLQPLDTQSRGLRNHSNDPPSGLQCLAISILKIARDEHHPIHDPPDHAAAKCEHLHDADQNMACVQAVYAQPTQHVTQHHRDYPAVFVLGLL